MKLQQADAIALGEVLTRALVARGWSVREGATRASTSHMHLYRLLQGQANPTLSRLLCIARRWDYPELFDHLGMLL